MADAMKGVTVALGKMNKKLNLPALQKIMTEFIRENEKSEVTQEIMGDAIDDAMEEEGSAEEESSIVNQVLDELGVNAMESTPSAPMSQVRTGGTEGKVQVAEAMGGGGGGGGDGGSGGGDGGVSELEARLNQLRNG
jgi:charged multivesicular body protein 2A